jgi:hypothetical protein
MLAEALQALAEFPGLSSRWDFLTLCADRPEIGPEAACGH